jgi:hypothetical protein
MIGFTRLICAWAAVSLFVPPHTSLAFASEDDPASLLSFYLSCAAFARIQTGKYPAAVAVYMYGESPVTQTEAEEALIGLRWTNRVFVSKRLAAHQWSTVNGQVPTNGDLKIAVSNWEREITGDGSDSRGKALAGICASLYADIDSKCGDEVCF